MSVKYGNDGSNPYNQEGSGQFNERSKTPRDYWQDEAEYTNLNVTKFPDGTSIFHDITKGKEMIEMTHPSGSSIKVLPDGSVDINVNNATRFYHKGSKTDTVHGNLDSKIEGVSRTSITGGSHSEVKGDETKFVGGGRTEYVDKHVALWTKDKFSVGAQQGVGFSVSEDRTQLAKITINPDSTITIWNTKSSVVLKPDGTIVMDAVKIEMKADQSISMEAPTVSVKAATFDVKAFISHSGSMVTSGVHTDSNGVHV